MKIRAAGTMLLAGLCGLACGFKTTEDYPSEAVLSLRACALCLAEDCEVADESSTGDDGESSTGDPEGCDPPVITANGIDRVRLIIEFPHDSVVNKVVTLTTDLGVLDPTAQGAMRATRTLTTNGAGSLSTLLYAGSDSGEALVRATIGTATAELLVTIAPALPTELGLIASPAILEVGGSRESDLKVSLDNTSEPRATVSAGLDVHFGSCSARGRIADVPKIVRNKAEDPVHVTAILALNAAGEGITHEVGSAVELFVYAYVLEQGEPAPMLTDNAPCATLADVEAEMPAIHAVRMIEVRRKTE